MRTRLTAALALVLLAAACSAPLPSAPDSANVPAASAAPTTDGDPAGDPAPPTDGEGRGGNFAGSGT